MLEEEARDSDDNIETVMKRFEDEYNKPHRSNIYVTGTLSVVFDEHTVDRKLINSTYFDNIDENNYPSLHFANLE